jgi:hypothetical protein
MEVSSISTSIRAKTAVASILAMFTLSSERTIERVDSTSNSEHNPKPLDLSFTNAHSLVIADRQYRFAFLPILVTKDDDAHSD